MQGQAPVLPPEIPNEINGQKGPMKDRQELIPGCANPPINVQISDCCKTYPQLVLPETWKNCSKSCGGKKQEGFCCTSECILRPFTNSVNGRFEADKVKESIAKLTSSDAAWTSSVSIRR